jgi:tripartite ATP-independent transporter DctP family solute receptor
MVKRFFLIALIALVTAGMATARGGQEEETAPAVKMQLRYAHSNVPIYFYHTAGEAFAQQLNTLTDERITVKLFPQGQLGGERDVTEGLQLGTVDFQATSIGVTGTFIPAVRILNLPFIFLGPKHFVAVMEGPIGAELLKKAQQQGEAVGLKVLSIAAADFRLPMNDVRAVNVPDDFKGVKMRTMEVPTHMAAYKALGANPVPLPFGELYTALQTDVVDGNENGPLALFGNKFYEVQKYVTLLPVVSNAGIFLMSQKTWDKLSPADQEAVMKSVSIWTKVMNEDAIELGGWAIEQMKKSGIQVNQVQDISAFVKKAQTVYPDFYESLPVDLKDWARDMVTRIQAAAAGIEEGDWFAGP